MYLEALATFQLKISENKMRADIRKLVSLYKELEVAGVSVTLTFSSRGRKSIAKPLIESSSSPTPSTSTPTSGPPLFGLPPNGLFTFGLSLIGLQGQLDYTQLDYL